MSANRFQHFNDGEGLEFADLNDITSSMLKAMGDGWHYGSAVAASNINPGQYAQQYDADVYQRVFCHGWAGSVMTNGSDREIVIQPGVMGMGVAADGGSGASPHALADFAPSTVWWLQPSGQAFTLSANASGMLRYDLVTVALTGYETTGDSETRDFEDAITGALTTTTPDKRRRVAPTWAVTEGTPGAGIPATPAGTAAVASIAVPDSATSLLAENVRDFTIPLRHGVEYVTTLGFHALTDTTDWGADNVDAGEDVDISTTISGVTATFYPPARACDPLARLIGIVISHECDDAVTFELIRNPVYNSGGSKPILTTISAGTTDGQPRSIAIPSASWADVDGDLPIWLNGFHGGRAIELRDGLAGLGPRGRSSVALLVSTNSTDAAQINAVTWIVAR